MDKLNLITKDQKKNYFYFQENNQLNLVITNKKINNFNLDKYTVSLISNNITRYIRNNIIIEIISNVDLSKLENIDISKMDVYQLSNIISNPCSIKNNKLNYIIVKETYPEYKKKIVPYIKSIYKENTNWFWEIVKGNREKENVLYQDKEIIILKELSMVSSNKFYIIGFPLKKITCLREIKREDLPLLDKLVNKMNEIAKTMANLESNSLYNFFHYHPSFYHLHLHCTFINNLNINGKFLRYHIYDIVKNNLLRNKSYYKRNDLYFEIPKNHIICDLLK